MFNSAASRATPVDAHCLTGSTRRGTPAAMAKAKPHDVYTLLVEAGRAPGDGLPDGATGAALMCYAAGVDEAEAVRETVAILKQADTYEDDRCAPERFGRERLIVIGKHSGISGLRAALTQAGITVSDDMMGQLKPLLRAFATREKRPVTSDDLRQLVSSLELQMTPPTNGAGAE